MHFKMGNIPFKGAMIVLAIMLPSTLLASVLVTWIASFPQYQLQTEWDQCVSDRSYPFLTLFISSAIIFLTTFKA